MRSSTGKQYTIYRFMHVVQDVDRYGATVVRRQDSFETSEGNAVLLSASGIFSVFENGEWVDLVHSDDSP